MATRLGLRSARNRTIAALRSSADSRNLRAISPASLDKSAALAGVCTSPPGLTGRFIVLPLVAGPNRAEWKGKGPLRPIRVEQRRPSAELLPDEKQDTEKRDRCTLPHRRYRPEFTEKPPGAMADKTSAS